MERSDYHPPNLVDSTSSKLLSRIRRQDQKAWRLLVRVYGPVVRYWIVRAGLNKTDLQDVFQDVFIAVSRNVAQFKQRDGKALFRAWLKTITHSKILDHFRKQGKQPLAVGGTTVLQRMHNEPGAIETPSEAFETDDDAGMRGSDESLVAQRMLDVVKCEFRNKTWLAFYRTAIDGLTSQEVAAELNMQPAAVRQAKSRVLSRLRELLNP